MDTRTSTYRLRIERVRDALRAHGLARLLVPSSDPHLSEYLPERWQGRQWLSGFTGSMGTLVVTTDQRRAVRRQPLLDAGRGRTRRQRHRAGEDSDRRGNPPPRLAARDSCRRRRRSPSTARCSGWPRRRRCATRSARPASSCAPISTSLDAAWPDRPACRCGGLRAPARRMPRVPRARQAGAGARRRWPRMARPIISSRRSTTSPGSSICAAPTSSYNPVFLAHAAGRPDTARRCSSAAGKIDQALRAQTAGRRHQAGRLRRRRRAALAALPPTSRLLIDPKRVTLRLARTGRGAGARWSRRSIRARC